MTIVKQAVIELILLTVASVGVALAANQIRERKSIDITKNYFDRGTSPTGAGNTEKVNPRAPKPIRPQGPQEQLQPPSRRTRPPDDRIASAEHPHAGSGSKVVEKKPLEHDYQTITVDEAHEVLDDPKTGQGLNIFVDARDDEHFAEGHIPGAIQCFPYESRRCLDQVKAAADGAEKVIVYCEGGDCEDSIFMSRELQEAGVPYEAIYLFEGGWKEWSAKGLHTETGK